MSNKWRDNKDNDPQPVMTTTDKEKKEVLDKRNERLVEWTFQMAKTMMTTNRWTLSVIPSTALNLAKEIDSHLQSVGLLPKSEEEKQS